MAIFHGKMLVHQRVHFVCQPFAWSKNAIRNSGLPSCNSQGTSSCTLGILKKYHPIPSFIFIKQPRSYRQQDHFRTQSQPSFQNKHEQTHFASLRNALLAITSEHILIAASTAHSTLIAIILLSGWSWEILWSTSHLGFIWEDKVWFWTSHFRVVWGDHSTSRWRRIIFRVLFSEGLSPACPHQTPKDHQIDLGTLW